MNNYKSLTASILIGFLGYSLMINAPSILQGYGPQVAASIIIGILLPPGTAFLASLASHILALPLLIGSHAVFPLVAYLSLVLRPIESFIASKAYRSRGYACSALAGASFEAFAATLISIVYYGDDGIHVGLSIFGLIPALMAAFTIKVYRQDRLLGAIEAAALVLYVLSTAFYFSPASILAVGAALAATPYASTRKASTIAGILLLLIALAGSANAVAVNTSILLYPYKPSSWSSDRWSIDSPLCGHYANVFSGTHTPERLRIIEPCITVEGTVAGTPKLFEDGDYCFDLSVANGTYAQLVDPGNLVLRKGHLHVEIVRADQTRILGALGGEVCSGDRLIVRGPLVVDTDHGQWAEVHPALNITLVERGSGPCINVVNGSG